VETEFDFKVLAIEKGGTVDSESKAGGTLYVLKVEGLVAEVSYNPGLNNHWSGTLQDLSFECPALVDSDRGRARSCFALRTLTWVWDDTYTDVFLLEEVDEKPDIYRRVGFSQIMGHGTETLTQYANRKSIVIV
jgi:hypothetical protein